MKERKKERNAQQLLAQRLLAGVARQVDLEEAGVRHGE